MKDKKLKIGTLCTVREGRVSYDVEKERGYWVVTANNYDALLCGSPYVRAFSLTHQHHYWWKPDDLMPVVKSGG
jgi:hypothetical protein